MNPYPWIGIIADVSKAHLAAGDVYEFIREDKTTFLMTGRGVEHECDVGRSGAVAYRRWEG